MKGTKRKQEGELFQIMQTKQKLFQHNVNKANLVHINGMSQRIIEFGG